MEENEFYKLWDRCDHDIDQFISMLIEVDGMNTSYHNETVQRLEQTIKNQQTQIQEQKDKIIHLVERLRLAENP